MTLSRMTFNITTNKTGHSIMAKHFYTHTKRHRADTEEKGEIHRQTDRVRGTHTTRDRRGRESWTNRERYQLYKLD
jgi:hypothetical protein